MNQHTIDCKAVCVSWGIDGELLTGNADVSLFRVTSERVEKTWETQ